MKKLRVLLFPFGWIYGFITALRNVLYNLGVFKVYIIPGKSICVGNLSVGGEGKTPLTDYLISHFLNKNKSISTLSRGFGRESKGVREASLDSTATDVGDEPLLFKSKHKESIRVFVAEKRKDGVQEILRKYPKNDLIILDDAFQHRAVKAGLNIVVTSFQSPYFKDFPLPAGNLREFRIGINRADLVVISKCPSSITDFQKKEMTQKINLPKERVFFSKIQYGNLLSFGNSSSQNIQNVLLVTGIANPEPMFSHLKSNFDLVHLMFKDHHSYTQKDINLIHEKFDTFASQNKAIITTEKDFMRIKKFIAVFEQKYNWFYLPISTSVDEQDKFNFLLDEYVNKV